MYCVFSDQFAPLFGLVGFHKVVKTAAPGESGPVADTTMAASGRVATPPPLDIPCPVAENWCYTQVSAVL